MSNVKEQSGRQGSNIENEGVNKKPETSREAFDNRKQNNPRESEEGRRGKEDECSQGGSRSSGGEGRNKE